MYPMSDEDRRIQADARRFVDDELIPHEVEAEMNGGELPAEVKAAILARMTRASLLEELRELYVLAARARGLSRLRAIVRHAFRNSLIPVVTIVGLQFARLLGGTIIIETIFGWPGVGLLIFEHINARDFPVLQAAVLLLATFFVSINLVVDLLYRLVNPRVELS